MCKSTKSLGDHIEAEISTSTSLDKNCFSNFAKLAINE
ncbi:hypothetical protein D051_2742 [Vibrio parahaemolyticus VPCR-2010]|nr:hypothetical protein D019_2504 [Vibrio parahaemolyticus VP2007-095]EQL85737.1 hypothetical protein D052_1689 [Vibrio parahaemolyticus 10290]EQM41162.1 hypothetical protein D051_2742 [Vibrio parahaemolyticus VPCR-2010]EQM44784.1 hypothetical protein D042_4572 [Vibrio parahaemolyticus NIHCB0757]ESV69759.1 hypothetical protein D021_1135 [Vibrio parahaemolyticus 10296]ESW45774.1 hypothetical protein D022_1094 [Vibrio parahaemolyticus 12310]ETT18970.1 hypothetical protein D028_0004 [Vibrio para